MSKLKFSIDFPPTDVSELREVIRLLTSELNLLELKNEKVEQQRREFLKENKRRKPGRPKKIITSENLKKLKEATNTDSESESEDSETETEKKK